MKIQTIILASLACFSPLNLSGHCQVPCGIYADNNVAEKLMTDVETITKASAQIVELSKDPSANAHQLTRWINNKESHCAAIQDTICQYYLAQRLKTDEAEKDKEAYVAKLTLYHKIIVTAMKCKQSTDSANTKKLRELVSQL